MPVFGITDAVRGSRQGALAVTVTVVCVSSRPVSENSSPEIRAISLLLSFRRKSRLSLYLESIFQSRFSLRLEPLGGTAAGIAEAGHWGIILVNPSTAKVTFQSASLFKDYEC